VTFLPWLFPALALLAAVAIPSVAAVRRGRRYAAFSAIALAFSLPGLAVSYFRIDSWFATVSPALKTAFELTFAFAMAALMLHMTSMVKPRLRPFAVRLLVNGPGQTFLASGALAGAWLLLLLPFRLVIGLLGDAALLEPFRALDLLPFVLAVACAIASPRLRRETVPIALAQDGPDEVSRVPLHPHRGLRAPQPGKGVLRIAQVSDPHLGPWQSIGQLKRTLETLLACDPDLVLLTGDYLTMEGNGTPGALAKALRPLRHAEGRCFAILGNHDHEAPEEVRGALAENKVRLLVDEEALVTTAAGNVQILGSDYVRTDHAEHLEALGSRFPRQADYLRLLLLHDPQGFAFVADGEADLVLSGHTHGGQVGLVSLGLDWTVLSRSRWPDHGLFAKGRNRLYVHRGTGFYGFPLRIGVPGEASILEVTPAGR